jgi:3-hydroxymyristoyl/3-hydroxydecanoyl-(acyl carrier protein) dehydratase
MGSGHSYTMEDIRDVLPHREPFLFVDEVRRMVVDESIVTARRIRPDEPYFTGHFPGKPVMPGVLVTDALAQTSGLLWGLSKKEHGDDGGGKPRMFYLAAVNMKYVKPAYPGDELVMTAHTERRYGNLYTYAVEAQCGRRTVAKGTVTLAMMDGEP